MANYPEKFFKGTAQTVINTSSNIAATNFSGAPSATYDNTTDSAVPYARYALATISIADWAAAPVAGTTVDLYGVQIDVDGTSDDTDAPATTVTGGGKHYGSWIVAGVDAAQRRTIRIDVEGATKIDFYIKNSTAQSMTNSVTPCTVKVTPLAYGFVV